MPLILREELPGNITLGLWMITEPLEVLVHQVVLSSEDAARLTSRSGVLKKQQFLAARILLSTLSGRDFSVSYLESGQPYGVASDLGISISHSGIYAAVAIRTEGRPVGVDVERMPRPSLLKAADFFLNESEQKDLEGKKTVELLHLYWSAKEALFKYRPAGNFRDDYRIVSIDQTALEATIGIAREPVRLRFWTGDGYMLVVAGS